MSETKRIKRNFMLTVVWLLFVTLTLSGIVYAGERTAYVSTGKEPQTVKIDGKSMFIKTQIPQKEVSVLSHIKLF